MLLDWLHEAAGPGKPEGLPNGLPGQPRFRGATRSSKPGSTQRPAVILRGWPCLREHATRQPSRRYARVHSPSALGPDGRDHSILPSLCIAYFEEIDFEKFAQCLELIAANRHLTREGLADIAAIAQTMN